MNLIVRSQVTETHIFSLSDWYYSIHDGVLNVYPIDKRNSEQYWFPLQTLIYFKTTLGEGED